MFSCYGKDKSLREWALCLRIVLLLSTLFIALSAPYLIELMGLIGNITGMRGSRSTCTWCLGTMLSFVWPAYFHLRLKGERMTEQERRFNKGVIGTGIGLMVIGVYYSSMELRAAMKYEES